MSPDKDIPVQKKKNTILSTYTSIPVKRDTRLSLGQLMDFIKRIKPVFEEVRIKENDERFIKQKGRGTITRDLNSIASYQEKEKGDEENIKRLMVSNFLTSQINKNDWLGENAEAFPISDVDRIERGADIIVKVIDEKTKQPTHFVIDVTFFGDSMKGKNIEKIKNNIRYRNMEVLKYPAETQEDTSTQNKGMARVVAGFDDNNLTTVASYWLMEQKNPEMTEALKQSPFQIVLLEEIIKQLEHYIIFAEKKAKSRSGGEYVISEHEKLLSIMKNIEQEKLIRSGYGSVEEYFKKMGKKPESVDSKNTIDEICNAIIKYLNDPKFMEGGYTTD